MKDEGQDILSGSHGARSIRAQVERIIKSPRFIRSKQLCAFLHFCAERALTGRKAELKENIIGIEVFGRPTSFDPRLDPVVRVQARRLRHKLREYYEHEGAADPIRIDLSTIGYVPSFRTQDAHNARKAGSR